MDDNEIKLPGDRIAVPTEYMGGFGIYENNGYLYASVIGRLRQVQKHVYIEPIKTRYFGDVGDVVIARVDEVQSAKQRWLLNVGSGQRGVLQLASAQLSTKELAIRNDTDARDMRKHFLEGDVLCTEVQRVGSDGVMNLHTRSAKYGKLDNGCLVSVPSSLIHRQASHWCTLSCLFEAGPLDSESRLKVIEEGVGGGRRVHVFVILGMNGGCWIGKPPPISDTESLNYRKETTAYEVVDPDTRLAVARVRNSICLLSAYHSKITPESIRITSDLSVVMNIPVPHVHVDEPDASKILMQEVSAFVGH